MQYSPIHCILHLIPSSVLFDPREGLKVWENWNLSAQYALHFLHGSPLIKVLSFGKVDFLPVLQTK